MRFILQEALSTPSKGSGKISFTHSIVFSCHIQLALSFDLQHLYDLMGGGGGKKN